MDACPEVGPVHFVRSSHDAGDRWPERLDERLHSRGRRALGNTQRRHDLGQGRFAKGLITDRYTVRARNTGVDSANAIHHDDVARDYGFRGGLVPGVDVYAYMVPAAVTGWNERWLEHGAMTARFRKPVYDGEEVTVQAHSDKTIELVN